MRKGGRTPFLKNSFVWLAVLNVLWANMHIGFFISYAVLGAYLLGEYFKHRPVMRSPHYRQFLAWALVAVLATLINPNSVKTVAFGINEVTGTWAAYTNIIELNPPWVYPALSGVQGEYLYLLALITAVTFSIMALSWRRLGMSHVLLFLGFAYAGASAFRFTLLFVLVSVAVSSRYAGRMGDSVIKKIRPAAIALAALAALAAAFMLLPPRGLAGQNGKFYHDGTLPVKAATFISEMKPSGPLLNSFNWGGYLGWRLYPEYKVFIESRLMDLSVFDKLMVAHMEGIGEVLEEYGINTVIYWPADPRYGEMEGIVLDLLKYKGWRLVYFDLTATVFVRKGTAPSLPTVDKQMVLDYLEFLAFDQIRRHHESPVGYFQLADIYYVMGREKEAERAYRTGLSKQ